MGLLRLGFITIFLSDPLISGFTTGAACWVFTSQIKHIIAIYPERDTGPFALIKVRYKQTNSLISANVPKFTSIRKSFVHVYYTPPRPNVSMHVILEIYRRFCLVIAG